MRRPIKDKRIIRPDRKYNSVKVSQFINYIMERGKKEVARKIVYQAFEEIAKVTKKDALEVFETALKNVAPNMEVKSRRIGGANYQVPIEVKPSRKQSLAFRWIIDFAKKKSGSAMYKRLADEIVAAANNESEAVKKRENTHKMAEANKAFAHFAW